MTTTDISDLIARASKLTDAELATAFKAWRKQPYPMRLDAVAPLLGIPFATLQKVEQGRGFRYPKLLLLAMQHLKPRGRWR